MLLRERVAGAELERAHEAAARIAGAAERHERRAEVSPARVVLRLETEHGLEPEARLVGTTFLERRVEKLTEARFRIL